MQKTVFGWIVVLGLALGAYVQHTGCTVDGLPQSVQPHVRSAQAACTQGCVRIGSVFNTSVAAVKPCASSTQAACSRGLGYAGSRLALLGNKLVRGCQWIGAKVRGLFPAKGGDVRRPQA